MQSILLIGAFSGEFVAVKKIWGGVRKEVESGDVEKGGRVQDNAFDAG